MEHDDLFLDRMTDLADRAWQKNITVYTGFLDLHELNLLHRISWKDHGVTVICSGGYESAERQMASFQPDAFSFAEESRKASSDYGMHGKEYGNHILNGFPMTVLEILPLSARFAEPLSHRDYLGSILALGIDRSVIGDLMIRDGICRFFCLSRMADYLCDNLTRVRHTEVRVSVYEGEIEDALPPVRPVSGSVASVRLDAVTALAFGLSRSAAAPLISGGAVFVNAVQEQSSAYALKENDIVSVRGKGKYRYKGVSGSSKKGRLFVQVEVFT